MAQTCAGCGRVVPVARFDSPSARHCRSCKSDRKAASNLRISILRAEPIAVVPTREPDEGDCPEHLAWIGSLPCACHGPDCRGRVIAHHVRRETGAGTALKPSDRWAVPLCRGIPDVAEGHHGEGHRAGWDTFEAKYNRDLRALAQRLAERSPALRRDAA